MLRHFSNFLGLLFFATSTWYYFFRSVDSGAQTVSNSLLWNVSKEQQKLKWKNTVFFLAKLLYSICFVPSSFFLYKSTLHSLCLSSAFIPPQAFLHLITINVISPSACSSFHTSSVLFSFLLLLNSSLSIFFPLFLPPLCQHSPLTRPDKRWTHTHTAVPTSPQWPLYARLCG